VAIKQKKYIFAYCISISFALCFAQVSGRTMFILPVLGVFLVLAAWSSFKGYAFPVLLYFLPWSPLVKISPGSLSFYTLALIIACVFRPHLKIKKKYLFVAVCLGVLTMISKLIYGHPVEKSYMLFIALLVCFPILFEESENNYDFNTILVYFSAGIITAALSARYFMYYRNISRYIVDASYLQFTRLTGFYGDPNFYAAHIIAAICGVLVKIYYEKDKKRVYSFAAVVLILIYCGLLSASKSFALLLVVALPVWIFMIIKERGRFNIKISIIVAVVCAIFFISRSDRFITLITNIIMRFKSADGISGFTTGRTDIWLNYIKAFASDIYMIFMGNGFSDVSVRNHAAHNTVIQLVYQFGLIGVPFIIYWYRTMFREKLERSWLKKGNLSAIILILLSLAPWLALDVLFFDEFFLMPLYVVEGINFIIQNSRTHGVMHNDGYDAAS